MTKVPLTCPDVGPEDARDAVEVIRSGDLEQGMEVESLERQFAEFTGARYAVAVNTGTAALHLALLAHGVGQGSCVYSSALTEPLVLDAICQTGAIPVLVDVDPYTYTMSPQALESVLHSFTHRLLTSTDRCDAVVAVHLFGQPCDMAPIRKLADANGLATVEVAWDALGASYHGSTVGQTGTAAFSFQRGRAINTGEGGMLTTDSELVAFKTRKLRDYGCDCCGRMDEHGFNYRMTDLIAALATSQLERVNRHIQVQGSAAMSYAQGLCDVEGITLPSVLPGTLHAFQRYGVRLNQSFPLSPAGAVKYMANRGIETRRGNPTVVPPIARAACGNGRDPFPEAERVAEELLLLPMHSHMDTESIAMVVQALRAVAWE